MGLCEDCTPHGMTRAAVTAWRGIRLCLFHRIVRQHADQLVLEIEIA